LRLSYSKFLSATDTNIAVAAYRFSSGGFLSLENAMAIRETGNLSPSTFGASTQRNSLQVTINQALPRGWGSFYLTGTAQDYWGRSGTDTQFQAGYNNNFGRINYGVSISRQYELTTSQWDNRVMLTASVPLGIGSHAPYSSTSVQHDSNGSTSIQQSLSGTLGVDNAASYGVNVGYSSGGQTTAATSAGGNVSYRSPMSTITANASASSGYSQYGAGISGSVVGYGGGVVFSPLSADTMAIVEAKDAAGARIATQNGLRIDPWGHALVPGLVPFASNEIEIDPKGLPVSVELESTSEHVAPTVGAVSVVKFKTDNPGASVIIRTKMVDGKPLPFGADVLDAAGQTVGTVAQNGRVIAHGLKNATGDLKVQWSEGTNRQSCKLSYSLPPTVNSKSTSWTTIDSDCMTQ